MDEKKLSYLKKTFVRQHSQFYCGLACLASIVRFYGGDTDQEKLREISGTTLQGSSLLGLFQSAKKMGLDADGYQTNIESLKNIEIPVIIHLQPEKKLEHYVVCYHFENERFIIGDPASGIITYTTDELEHMWESKTLLYLRPNSSFVKKAKMSDAKKTWFKQFLKDDIPTLLTAAFLGIILSILGLATSIYLQKLIDDILPAGDKNTLFISLSFFFAILLIRSIASYIRGILLIKQSRDLNIRMVSMFFSKILFLPKNFFDSVSTGDLVGRLNDSQRIQRVVISLFSNILVDVFIVVVSITYIFIVSNSAGFLSLLSIPLFLFLAYKYNHKVIDSQRDVMQAYALTESAYIDTIQGIGVIKIENKERVFSKSVKKIYELFQGKVYNLGILGNKINLLAQLGNVFLLSSMIALTSYLVFKDQLQMGELIAIITIFGSFIVSLISVAMANIQLQEAKVAFSRMYEYSSIEPEYVEEDKLVERTEITIKSLEIDGLSFRFAGKPLLLKNISLNIKRGESATLFGEVGCGKSTLLSILQRFYAFESGAIRINDFLWTDIPISIWRGKVGVVPQNVKLFNGTVIENISLCDNTKVEDVVAFCQQYGFEPFINRFQQGYATIINENSTNLSGGQQQLIALARALYGNPQILLLDEATSAMDSITEHFVLNLINSLKKKMIIIFVTHRIHLAAKADKVFVIENGEISANGTPEEVMKISQLYYNAYIGTLPS